jgi:hypothetical protein
VPLDLEKLESLRRPAADYVAVLLLGFDSEESSMDADVTEMAALARLDQPPWTQATDGWLDRDRPGSQILCWLWWRAVR